MLMFDLRFMIEHLILQNHVIGGKSMEETADIVIHAIPCLVAAQVLGMVLGELSSNPLTPPLEARETP